MGPETNKNSNLPELQPVEKTNVSDQLSANTPSLQTSGVYVSAVSPSPTQKDPNKITLKKILLAIILTVVVLPFVSLFLIFVVFFAAGSVKMNKLNGHAKDLEKQLSSLVFIQGQSINAKGVVDGDVLTASDNPDVSTFAQATVDVDKPLAELESEINTNLSKSGFIREGTAEAPFYSTDDNGGSYEHIIFRYIKGEQAIRVMYKLDQSYECPKDYICKRTSETQPTDNIYPVNGFGTLTISRMSINLANKSSDYHTGYR